MDEMQKGKYEFMIKKHNMYMYIHTHILLYFQEGKYRCRENNIVLGDRIFEFMS